jgi:hypothetical protein
MGPHPDTRRHGVERAWALVVALATLAACDPAPPAPRPRARHTAERPEIAPTPREPVPADSSEPAPSDPAACSPDAAAPDERTLRVAEHALAALETQRAALRAACWTPIVARAPLPANARFVLALSFDATGAETRRAIREIAGMSRADVAACLRARSDRLHVEAPGAPIDVEVRFTLP